MLTTHASAAAAPTWSQHALYGLMHEIPADAEIYDDAVSSALSERDCECLSIVNANAARVYDRKNMEHTGTARIWAFPDGRRVLTIYWHSIK